MVIFVVTQLFLPTMDSNTNDVACYPTMSGTSEHIPTIQSETSHKDKRFQYHCTASNIQTLLMLQQKKKCDFGQHKKWKIKIGNKTKLDININEQ